MRQCPVKRPVPCSTERRAVPGVDKKRCAACEGAHFRTASFNEGEQLFTAAIPKESIGGLAIQGCKFLAPHPSPDLDVGGDPGPKDAGQMVELCQPPLIPRKMSQLVWSDGQCLGHQFGINETIVANAVIE